MTPDPLRNYEAPDAFDLGLPRPAWYWPWLILGLCLVIDLLERVFYRSGCWC